MAYRSPHARRATQRRPQGARRSSLGTMKWLLFITIAIVLAKVVVPPLTKTMLSRKLEEPIDRTAVKVLETAINAYRLQAYQLPSPKEWSDEAVAHPTDGPWLAALLGEKSDLNPDGTVYLTLPAAPSRRGGIYRDAKGVAHLTDQFGRPFQVHFDFNGDGRIPNPRAKASDQEPQDLPGSVLIYSLGTDGKADSWGDNLTSW